MSSAPTGAPPAAAPGPGGESRSALGPLHASEMRLLLACPRKWHHAHVSRRVPRAESEALTRGRAVHEYLAHWWAGESAIALPEDPIARACCIGYGAYWGSPPAALSIQVEHPWKAALGSVECAGTLDALMVLDGEDVIVEHKTTSQDITPGSMYWRQVVTTDAQVSMYRAAFPGAKIVYDVIRKPALRQKQNETADQFVARCIEAMAKEPERYFQRATVVRLESEDEAFARDVVSIDRLRRGKDHPRNPASCFAYGTRCGYFDTCWGAVPLSDDGVYRDQDEGR